MTISTQIFQSARLKDAVFSCREVSAPGSSAGGAAL